MKELRRKAITWTAVMSLLGGLLMPGAIGQVALADAASATLGAGGAQADTVQQGAFTQAILRRVTLAAGDSAAEAITPAGAVEAWGDRETNPLQVPGLANVVAVVGGYLDGYALD